MNQVIAKLRYLRIAPRKVRLVADVIKNLPIETAEAKLLLLSKRASIHILKLLKSAIANAKHKNLNLKHLFIKDLTVDKGPVLKRWTPRARGSVSQIEKKTSHVTIVLGVSEKIVQPGFIFPVKKKSKTKEKKSKTKKEEAKKEKREDENKKIKAEETGKKKFFFRRKSI